MLRQNQGRTTIDNAEQEGAQPKGTELRAKRVLFGNWSMAQKAFTSRRVVLPGQVGPFGLLVEGEKY